MGAIRAIVFDTFGTIVDWRTAFIQRPAEYGPGQKTDLSAEDAWDFIAVDMVDLAEKLAKISITRMRMMRDRLSCQAVR